MAPIVVEPHSVRHGAGREVPGEASPYVLYPAGELLRPLLLIESGLAVGGKLRDLLPAALGAEFEPFAGLIGEGVVDRHSLRRGRLTDAGRRTVERAIRAGDALFFSLFGCLAEYRTEGVQAQRVIRALETAGAVAVDASRGRHLKAAHGDDLRSGRDWYLRVIGLGSGSVYRGACACGAILGGGSPEQLGALERYGERLGIVYRLTEDLAPYVSEPVDGGPWEARMDLPLLVAYEHCGVGERRRLERMLAARRLEPEDRDWLRALMDKTGAVAEVMSATRVHARQAKIELRPLPWRAARDKLEHYADLVLSRVA